MWGLTVGAGGGLGGGGPKGKNWDNCSRIKKIFLKRLTPRELTHENQLEMQVSCDGLLTLTQIFSSLPHTLSVHTPNRAESKYC